MTENNSIIMYGSDHELAAMAQRYKTALPNGRALGSHEAIALAQISKVTGLNPFAKEIWYIPGVGTHIGIAGMRKLWNIQFSDGWSTTDILPCDFAEAGATPDEIQKKIVVAAFRCELTSGAALREYKKSFFEAARELKEIGHPNPYEGAKELCGKKPMWVGWGYSTSIEKSHMNKVQLARKRAEADALKKCVTIPFEVNLAKDTNNDIIDADEIGYLDEVPDYNQEMEKLIKEFGAEKIISAFGGIPANVEQIEQARAKLQETK